VERVRIDSTVKKVREQFGLWKAAALSSEAVVNWQVFAVIVAADAGDNLLRNAFGCTEAWRDR